MFSYGNNLLRSRQPQTSHLLHLDAPYRQPSPSPPSPNSASPPPLKVTKPKRDNSQLSLTIISSPSTTIALQPSNLVSFLIHIGYETELRLQLSKFNNTVRGDFDHLDPSIIRNPTLINEPIDCKVQHTRKSFLHRIYAILQQFMVPDYNAVANFFAQPGFIGLEDLASSAYVVSPPWAKIA
ncbi:hypothetical protein G6F46_007651 [Rhizopus delemar]|uniref:C2 PI3K-type domain-containing protein n=2 Tax=Rhizopus TaxID=4842 RepID=A0A9P7CNQ1_9FUNG|nr:hypothetical protein G6F55_005803 [Rhizopus delemar]KAG1541493.1 hypothetical protein G6F51_007862 [Rhizopus arrhizus]KAG1495536.1 hypothetical protein G6F54_007100 [Rhizopus delemar]KAG1509922.1 hypothetical protein G6F53_007072 [Rhizopus delemar]KAG1525042.1 hypothetical protein G6F52_003676 [Rhizopus delemar]